MNLDSLIIAFDNSLRTVFAPARAALEEAAREETDHLAWCESRINELGGRKSLLNPCW